MTNRTLTNTPAPAKPKPTAQTVLKCLGFATYSAYWLHRQQTRTAPPVESFERLNNTNTNTNTDNNAPR